MPIPRFATIGLLLFGLSIGFAPIAMADDAADLRNGLLSICREMVASRDDSSAIPDRTTCECLEAGLQTLVTPESMRGGLEALKDPIERLSKQCVTRHVRNASPEFCRAGFTDHYEIRTEADRAEVEKVCGCVASTLERMDDQTLGERILGGKTSAEEIMLDCGLPEASGKLSPRTAR